MNCIAGDGKYNYWRAQNGHTIRIEDYVSEKDKQEKLFALHLTETLLGLDEMIVLSGEQTYISMFF